MASIALCEARRRDYAAIEEWAQANPDHPAAAPVLAAMNEDRWAVPLLTPTEAQAAYAAAQAAGRYVNAADRVEGYESDEAVRKAEHYLRALGY
jgi:hypothetical protein